MPGVLNIIEPMLADYGGHFYPMVQRVVGAARARGLEVRIFANRRARISVEGASVVPTFYRRIRSTQLAPLVPRLIRRGEHVLFTTASRSDFRGLDWARWLGLPGTARVTLYVHQRFASERRDAESRGRARRLPGLTIAVPSNELAAEMRALEFRDVRIVPCPHLAPDEAPVDPAEPFRLLVPGTPRPDKGTDAVADYAEALARRGSGPRLVVQVSDEPLKGVRKHIRPAVARLLACNYAGLTRIEHRPSHAEFASLFRGAVVLQPYVREAYIGRFSGVMLDALAAGCPIIVTSGTWVAQLVTRFGAGVAIDTTTPEAIDAAARAIEADLAGFRARALSAGRRLRIEHDGSALVHAALTPPERWQSDTPSRPAADPAVAIP